MTQTGFPSWSKTAASNGAADGNVNWAEGMAPSAVNDSARAMMAALAKYRDDHDGALLTGGTSSAYTLTSNQVFDSLADMSGRSLRVRFHTANGGSPVTLNVDGLGAKNIVTANGGSSITTGTLSTNAAYDLVYDNSNSNWILIGGQPSEFVSGTIMLFRQTAAPTGWTKDSSNFNNHAIRVTTGAVSSGGTTGFTSVFTGRTITQSHLPNVTLTTTITDPGHPHTYTNQLTAALVRNDAPNISVWQASGTAGQPTSTEVTGITASTSLGGSGGAFDMAVQYCDCIFATKA